MSSARATGQKAAWNSLSGVAGFRGKDAPETIKFTAAGECPPPRRLAQKPGVPAGGDCELLQVLLRVNERVFRPAGGRDGLCGCFAIFIAPQMTAGYLLQPPPAGRWAHGPERDGIAAHSRRSDEVPLSFRERPLGRRPAASLRGAPGRNPPPVTSPRADKTGRTRKTRRERTRRPS